MKTQDLIHSIPDGTQIYLYIIGVLLSALGFLYKENREFIKQQRADDKEEIKRLREEKK